MTTKPDLERLGHARELFKSIRDQRPEPQPLMRLDHDPTAPLPYAVWTVDDCPEILGAGRTAGEAMAEAGAAIDRFMRAGDGQ